MTVDDEAIIKSIRAVASEAGPSGEFAELATLDDQALLARHAEMVEYLRTDSLSSIAKAFDTLAAEISFLGPKEFAVAVLRGEVRYTRWYDELSPQRQHALSVEDPPRPVTEDITLDPVLTQQHARTLFHWVASVAALLLPE